MNPLVIKIIIIVSVVLAITGGSVGTVFIVRHYRNKNSAPSQPATPAPTPTPIPSGTGVGGGGGSTGGGGGGGGSTGGGGSSSSLSSSSTTTNSTPSITTTTTTPSMTTTTTTTTTPNTPDTTGTKLGATVEIKPDGTPQGFERAIDAMANKSAPIPQHPPNALRIFLWDLSRFKPAFNLNDLGPNIITLDPHVIVLQQCIKSRVEEISEIITSIEYNSQCYSAAQDNDSVVLVFVKNTLTASYPVIQQNYVMIQISQFYIVALYIPFSEDLSPKLPHLNAFRSFAENGDPNYKENLIVVGNLNLTSQEVNTFLPKVRNVFANPPAWTCISNNTPDHILTNTKHVVLGAYVQYVKGSYHVPIIADISTNPNAIAGSPPPMVTGNPPSSSVQPPVTSTPLSQPAAANVCQCQPLNLAQGIVWNPKSNGFRDILNENWVKNINIQINDMIVKNVNSFIPKKHASNQLRILTWNVNRFAQNNRTMDHATSNMAQSILDYEPDVILLQESIDEDESDKIYELPKAAIGGLPKLLIDLKSKYRVAVKSADCIVTGNWASYNTVILIKSELAFNPITSIANNDRIAGIKLAGFSIYSVHLSFNDPNKKVITIAELGTLSQSDNTIFAGDFNEVQIPNEIASYTKSAFARCNCGEPKWTGSGSTNIDHILVNSAKTVSGAYVYYAYGSDHVPLIMDIEK